MYAPMLLEQSDLIFRLRLLAESKMRCTYGKRRI